MGNSDRLKNGAVIISQLRFLFDIQFRRDIYLVGNIFAVLLPLAHALGEQVFNLTVNAAEVILRPGGNGIIELRGNSQWNLLFLLIICHGSVQAAAVDNRLGVMVAAEHHQKI